MSKQPDKVTPSGQIVVPAPASAAPVEQPAALHISTLNTWRDFLVYIGVNVARIEAELEAWKATHPDAGVPVDYALSLIRNSLGAAELEAIASAAATDLAASIASGHGKIEKETNPVNFA